MEGGGFILSTCGATYSGVVKREYRNCATIHPREPNLKDLFIMNLFAPFVFIKKNRELLFSLMWRDIKSKYSGSIMGWFWALITPLIMLGVYTFVFSVVFNARWGGQIESKSQFALFLFSGLIQFNFFSESVNTSALSILGNENYVKKIIFPLEVLPLVSCSVSLFHFCLSFLVWFVGYTLIIGLPSVFIVFFPLLFFPFILFIVGLSWFCSSLSVYLRDLPYILSLFCTLLLFMSPIFYSISSVPANYQWILELNPLTPFIENGRNLLMHGSMPSLTNYLVCLVVGLLTFFLGFKMFSQVKKGFSDVL